MIILVYVNDDLLIIGNSPLVISDAKAVLNKQFKLKDLGKNKYS